jgi:TolB-like protein/Tfp pilus assembly protein PilF
MVSGAPVRLLPQVNTRDRLRLTEVVVRCLLPKPEPDLSTFRMVAGPKVLYEFGPFRVDPDKQVLLREDQPVSITPKAFETLLILVRRSRETVSKDELMKAVWPDAFVEEANLSQNIFTLRKALGDTPENRRYIVTLPGRGYRFVAEVRTVTKKGEDLVIEGRSRSRVVVEQSTDQVFRSLAVLPFDNLSGDLAQDYFSEGMTEALITEMGKISAIRVISRQSMMQYKGTKKSVPQIARELMVDAVVEGSVLRVGERVRVSVQLIEADPERHLWANSYDRQVSDVLALHSEMARTVAKEIKVILTPQDETRLAGARAVNPAANESYFRGRYFLDRRTKENLDKALVDFQHTIEIEPAFAPAYASLSEVYLSLVLYDPTKQAELFAKARAASLKALEMDDTLSAAHYTLAVNRLSTWDWSGAESEYLRAIEVNPSNASAHWWYADLLIFQGRMTEAEAELQRAEALNPASLEIYGAATAFRYYARRYDELVQRCEDWLKRNPALGWVYHHCLGAAYVQMGRSEEAIAELREAFKTSTMCEHTATELANALAVAGRREEALKVLDEVQYVPWRTLGVALVRTGLGEKDEAFEALERAIELRAPFVTLIKVDPRFDSLRVDPRFQKLLRQMNLPS